jgi:hypothetical protein
MYSKFLALSENNEFQKCRTKQLRLNLSLYGTVFLKVLTTLLKPSVMKNSRCGLGDFNVGSPE